MNNKHECSIFEGRITLIRLTLSSCSAHDLIGPNERFGSTALMAWKNAIRISTVSAIEDKVLICFLIRNAKMSILVAPKAFIVISWWGCDHNDSVLIEMKHSILWAMIFFIISDCQRHVEKGAMHFKRIAAVSCAEPVSRQFAVDTNLQTIWAEVTFSTFLVEHNIPLNAADHDGSLLCVIYLLRVNAINNGCANMTTSNKVKVLAADDEQAFIQCMRERHLNTATDGSNAFEDVKLYPLVVRSFIASRYLSLLLRRRALCRLVRPYTRWWMITWPSTIYHGQAASVLLWLLAYALVWLDISRVSIHLCV